MNVSWSLATPRQFIHPKQRTLNKSITATPTTAIGHQDHHLIFYGGYRYRCTNRHCPNICASSGIPIPWVSELRYLGIYILKSRSFKCSLSIHRKAFYCLANAIFGKVGRIASEEVVLQLVNKKCTLSLLYDLETCPLAKSELASLDFVVNTFLYEDVWD